MTPGTVHLSLIPLSFFFTAAVNYAMLISSPASGEPTWRIL